MDLDLVYWATVDPLTLREAAYLCHNLPPRGNLELMPLKVQRIFWEIYHYSLPHREQEGTLTEREKEYWSMYRYDQEAAQILGLEIIHVADCKIYRNLLKTFVESKGIRPLILFPEISNAESEAAALFDPNSPTYPPELHIAVRAWQVVSANPSTKRTPKQQILEWLNEHHSNLSEEAKNRIAKVSNWKKEGGAPSSE